MAGNVGYVNVGSLINPTKGFTDSLARLSDTFGRQHESEQRAELAAQNKAENDRRWQIQQDANEKNQREQLRKKDANRIENEFLASIGNGRLPDFKLDDYDTKMQTFFTDKVAKYDKEQSAYKTYLQTGKDADLQTAIGLTAGGISVDSMDESKRNELLSTRKTNLQALRYHLQDLSDTEKSALINKHTDNLFSDRRAELAREIASGDSMVKSQKATALMRYLPEEVREYGSHAKVRNSIMQSLMGDTEEGLKNTEANRVASVNKALSDDYDKKMDLYKSELKRRRSLVDFEGLSKIFAEDLGMFDNEDRENIVDYLLKKNVPHDRVKWVVSRLRDSNLFGMDKSMYGLDSEEAQNLITIEVDKAERDNKEFQAIKPPEKWTPEKVRDIHEIQKSRLGYNSSNSNVSLGVLQEWKDSYAASLKSPSVLRLPNAVETSYNLPDTLTEVPQAPLLDNSPIVDGAFNPTREQVLAGVASAPDQAPFQQTTEVRLGSLTPDIAPKPPTGPTGLSRALTGGLERTDYTTDRVTDLHKQFNTAASAYNKRKAIEYQKNMSQSERDAQDARMYYFRSQKGEILPPSTAMTTSEKIRKRNAAITGKYTDEYLEQLARDNTYPKKRSRTVLPEPLDKRTNQELQTLVDPRTNSGVNSGSIPELMDRTNRLSVTPKTQEETQYSVDKYNSATGHLKLSDKPAHPDPKILHGSDAVRAVEAREGPLSELESRLVVDEGYSPDVYADSKGNLTTGVGQTGKFMDGSFKEAVATKVQAAKRLVPKFDELPVDIQYSILQAVYRGDAKADHDWISDINAGKFSDAAAELLDHKSYKQLKRRGVNNGVTRRLESASRSLLDYARQQ